MEPLETRYETDRLTNPSWVAVRPPARGRGRHDPTGFALLALGPCALAPPCPPAQLLKKRVSSRRGSRVGALRLTCRSLGPSVLGPPPIPLAVLSSQGQSQFSR